MDVRNCRMCGKLYNYIGGAYRGLCPNCIKIMEDKFIEVKEFINDNGTATMSEISEACDVSVKQIEISRVRKCSLENLVGRLKS